MELLDAARDAVEHHPAGNGESLHPLDAYAVAEAALATVAGLAIARWGDA